MPANSAPPLGVYVHWPYCARICPYCDFNVYRNRTIDAAAWTRALVADLGSWAARTPGRTLTSLYFGGGTPSLAPPALIASAIEACERLWGFEKNAEITLEANPTDAEQSRFAAFAATGVNRLSLGSQSFDDAALQFLGRDHSGADARRAIDRAQAAFPRVTFDLIYGLPDQSLEDWRAMLADALSTGVTHLSLYQLTIEPGTAFERAVARGRWAPPDDDVTADLYNLAQEMTAAAGLPAYEISNHAAPGAASRHNLLYWTGGDYIGVGPGAHGRITVGDERLATETPSLPDAYLAAASSGAAAQSEPLGAEAQFMERLSMGLRLVDGVLVTDGERAQLEKHASRLDRLETDGLIVRDGARLAATASGRRVLNHVLREIFA